MSPAQSAPCGMVRKVKDVTTPKLLEPPRRASQRSGFWEAEAVMRVPLGRARVKARTLSQPKPARVEK